MDIRIHRVRRDADRYIALHRHAYRVRISHRVCQLLVCMELQVVVQLLRLLVALCQERGIRLQPLFVLCPERFVFLAAEQRLLVALEERLEVLHLLVIHTLVVGYRLRVKRRLRCLIFLLLRGRQPAHLLNVDIYRVQRKHAHGVIRIRVAVGMRQRGVVDRQRLYHLLPRLRCPVCQLLQVLKLAYAEAVLRAQREHRHCHTCPFEARLRAAESAVVLAYHHVLLQTPYHAVLTPFHIHHLARVQVIHHVLVFYHLVRRNLYRGLPQRELAVAHRHFVIRVPVTQFRDISHDSNPLRRQHLRHHNAKPHITFHSLPL